MPSVLRLSNNRSRTTASLVLVGVTLLVLMVEHVSVSVQVSEARTPEVVLATVSAPVAKHAQAAAHPKTTSNGPGGSQPWVRWTYIP